MKPLSKKILIAAAIMVLLAVAFWWGGNAPGSHGWSEQQPVAADTNTQTHTNEPTANPQQQLSENQGDGAQLPDTADNMAPSQGKDSPGQPHSEATNVPDQTAEPNTAAAPGANQTTLTCTLSVRCDTILDHLDYLDAAKRELIPSDGVIFAATSVSFSEGESVLDVLLREMQAAGIAMEYVNTPGYGSAYIEGINNIYELDCGSLSGWMYRVNGVFPGYGCSLYLLEDGDLVELLYTCDLGADIGGSAATGQ